MLRTMGRERQQEIEVRQSIERLTRRELEVLRALAEGLDSQEISARLGISIETERTHMVNILGKLGLRSRLQAWFSPCATISSRSGSGPVTVNGYASQDRRAE